VPTAATPPNQHVAEEAACGARHGCAFFETPLQAGGNTHLARRERRPAAREKRVVLLGLQQLPRGVGMQPQRGSSGDFDQNDVFPGNCGRSDFRFPGGTLCRYGDGVLHAPDGECFDAGAARGAAVCADAGNDERDRSGHCACTACQRVGLKVARRTATGTATRTATKEVSYATAYEDFVIVAKRRNAREIGVRIDASPAGRMAEEVTVAFPVEEGVELCASFFGGSARGGRAEIAIDEAEAIGTRLADVLFPKTAFRLSPGASEKWWGGRTPACASGSTWMPRSWICRGSTCAVATTKEPA
jgi:hypothetical protein